MGRECSTLGKEGKCAQNFSRKTLRKEANRETGTFVGDNIEMNIKETGVRVRIGFFWLSIEYSDGLLRTW
jgi:hypothetical protein